MEKNDERRKFANMVVTKLISKLNSQKVDREKVYSGFEMLVNNQRNKTPGKIDMCDEMSSILEKLRTIFEDGDIQKIILENNITSKQFMSLYGEKILGDAKRQYDMSNRFKKELNETGASCYSELQNRKLYTYVDQKNNEIDIQEVGRLTYKEWNGTIAQINKYRVLLNISKDEKIEREVFTNINFTQMDNPEYKYAVLSELLSYNNIELSNAEGYIGEIRNVPNDSEKFEIESERENSRNYEYRVNDKYMLVYDSTDLDAVMRYSSREMQQGGNSKEEQRAISSDSEMAR